MPPPSATLSVAIAILVVGLLLVARAVMVAVLLPKLRAEKAAESERG